MQASTCSCESSALPWPVLTFQKRWFIIETCICICCVVCLRGRRVLVLIAVVTPRRCAVPFHGLLLVLHAKLHAVLNLGQNTGDLLQLQYCLQRNPDQQAGSCYQTAY